jgi:hypothetical protein
MLDPKVYTCGKVAGLSISALISPDWMVKGRRTLIDVFLRVCPYTA